MKKAAKLLAFSIIITLLVVSVAACAGAPGATGATGAQGLTGPAGLEGPQGDLGPVAQVVVCTVGYEPTCSVSSGEPVTILGACFPAGKVVTITYCDKNIFWAKEVANECGGFIIKTTVPAGVGDWADKVISVRAWVDDKVWANWPVYITPMPYHGM